ncbi:MAG: helix-turn-helix domain-containing protein [Pirellulales bacterium]|nr:helix-turn-helix domain-containing protein [Pirellulales bacterium]MBX3432543.1 helix-turn-helix domain-containing protein [Pirellulales bacterium]
MAAAASFRFKGPTGDAYLECVKSFPLRTISSDEHLAAAHEVIDRLLDKERLNDGESAYLDALVELAARYEDEHHQIPPASDAEMLRHLLEAKDVTAALLSRETGVHKSAISEVLSGKKDFSKAMIRKFAEYFEVDVSVLAANI